MAGFVLFVILGVVATVGSGGSYERIGESWLPQTGAPATAEQGVAEEARQLVLTRNRRRERNGEPPLDVEAEVARTLAELTDRGSKEE